MTLTQTLAYIDHIPTRGHYRARLRRYHAAKNALLPAVPQERHDAVICALCRRLRI